MTTDTHKQERAVWFLVGDVSRPAAEPFVVVRVDTKKRVGDGIQAVVESLHWSREEAERAAGALNAALTMGVH